MLAAFLVAPRRVELRELPRPTVGPEQAFLRVEACGVCGTDVDEYNRGPRVEAVASTFGHEAVGVIDEIGDLAAHERGLKVGDRVAVDPFIPCAMCRFCLTGRYDYCRAGEQNRPTLFGGYATYMLIPPRALLYQVPPGVDPRLAVLFNPLGGGIRWGVDVPGTTIGTTIVILGCGQRGLAALMAAKLAGAGLVVMTGLTKDLHKLELAIQFGASAVVNVDREDVVARVLEITRGLGVDVVVDTTPNATQPVIDAIKLIRIGGTIVVVASKNQPIPSFPIEEARAKDAVLRLVRGVGADAYRRALELIGSKSLPLERLQTHVFPLDRVGHAVEVLAGEHQHEKAINVVVKP